MPYFLNRPAFLKIKDEKNLSQTKIALLADVSKSTVFKCVHVQNMTISMRTAKAIANAMGVDVVRIISPTKMEEELNPDVREMVLEENCVC